MIIQGVDSNSVSHPLLVDASGRAIVSGIELTTTGGKVFVDASGRVYTKTSIPHSVYTLDSGAFVGKDGQANNNTVVLYTVTAGKTLYVVSIFVETAQAVAAGGSGYLQVRNTSDVVQYQWKSYLPLAGQLEFALSFPVPLSLAAGWDIALFSDNANTYAIGTFTGYEL